ncbi:MAG: hypothetical protein ABIV28_05355 [Longimicrobiales bacterium]
MIDRNQIRLAIAVIIVGVATGATAGRRMYAPKVDHPFEVGSVLPLKEVIHIDGGAAVELHEVLLKPLTVVTLFSTKCGACYGEAATWAEAANQRTDTDVYALAVTDDGTAVSEFSRKTGAKLQFGRISNATRTVLRAVAVPTIYVVHADGRIVFSESGPEATNDLKLRLPQLK